MRPSALLLAIALVFALVCPSYAKGWKTNSNKKARTSDSDSSPLKQTGIAQEKALARMRAYKLAAEEMGEDADAIAMLKRVEEITDGLLRASFPEASII